MNKLALNYDTIRITTGYQRLDLTENTIVQKDTGWQPSLSMVTSVGKVIKDNTRISLVEVMKAIGCSRPSALKAANILAEKGKIITQQKYKNATLYFKWIV